jgi:CRP/FNR family cyclic AMP-dependent transcriptional regulator
MDLLTTSQLADLFSKYPSRELVTGSRLFKDSDRDKYYYYLHSGSVKMSQSSPSGEEVTLHIFHPNSCIGLLSLAGSTENFNFEAVTATKVSVIPTTDFLQLINTNPLVATTFLVSAMKGMRGLLHRIYQKNTASAYQQVASLLVYYTSHLPTNADGSLTLPKQATHQNIAEWLGLTRENVSLQMKKLEQAGVLKRDKRQLKVVNLDSLEKEAGLLR